MSYEDKILDKFADMIMPPGTIIAYQGIEAPEGFIVYDHIKIYEDEFPRLYPVLAANPNFNKGADSDGRKWVELPEIDDLCIQMTTDTSQVGKTLEAQLPNITGSLRTDVNSSGRGVVFSGDGVFEVSSIDVGENSVASYQTYIATDKMGLASFKAQDSSNIYSGTSIQPKAIQCLPCIRT